MVLAIPESSWLDPSIVVAIIAAVSLALGAWLTWVASGTGRLQQRVDKLEERVQSLETEKANLALLLTLAASFINRIGLWLLGGQHAPRPEPPEQLRPHLDGELWEPDDRIGGTE